MPARRTCQRNARVASVAAKAAAKATRSAGCGPCTRSSRAGVPKRHSTQASAVVPRTKLAPRTIAVRTRTSARRRLVAVDRGAARDELAEDGLDRPVVEHLELARLELEAGPRRRVRRDAGRAGREDADHRHEAA